MKHQAQGFMPNLGARHGRGRLMLIIFVSATIFAVLCLASLLVSILNQTAGYVLLEYENPEAEVLPLDEEGRPLPIASLSADQLAQVLTEHISARRLHALAQGSVLTERPRRELEELVVAEVLVPDVIKTWTFFDSLFARKAIFEEAGEISDEGFLTFRFWLNPKFMSQAQSSEALYAGVRSATLGSFMTILLTILVAFPLGVGAAVYLEEYAKDNAFNRVIQTNIYNLAGVPSIIYGMLGLGIFVRALEPLTSGALLGFAEAGNGRTILSASLTLALLILPIIIINAQEALRAVPRSFRESGYALGATRWQVIWHHVLPASMDRILTGTVLALSRAVGETAPLVVVGASTFLSKDPTSIFSKFTTLPIQIYQWTARPQTEFRNIAAAAIVVLMVLLLSLNASAIFFRNKFRKEKRLG